MRDYPADLDFAAEDATITISPAGWVEQRCLEKEVPGGTIRRVIVRRYLLDAIYTPAEITAFQNQTQKIRNQVKLDEGHT